MYPTNHNFLSIPQTCKDHDHDMVPKPINVQYKNYRIFSSELVESVGIE